MNPANNTETWPVSAKFKEAGLQFSGTFDEARIIAEQQHKTFRTAGKIFLYCICLLGAAGLAVSAKDGLDRRVWDFLLERNVFNLSFWVSLVLSCYLWAQIKQEEVGKEIFNLLHWEEQAKNQKETDLYAFFTPDAKQVWNKSFLKAKARLSASHPTVIVTAIDLALSLLEDRQVQLAMARLAVSPQDMKMFLENYQKLLPKNSANELNRLPFTAFNEAIKLHNKAIDPLMLLCALKIDLPEEHVLQGIFLNVDVDLEDLEIVSSWTFHIGLLQEEIKERKRLAKFKPAGEINRGLTAVPTPHLDRFCLDLTHAAKFGKLPLTLGRGQDLTEMFKLFSGVKRSVLIKGVPGSGRTTLINELAYKMSTEQVPYALSDMRLLRLETAVLLGSGQKAEQSLIRALEEAESSGNIALVVPDIHELEKTQTSSGLTLLELLVNYLQGSGVCVFATSTNEDYSDYLRSTLNFDQVFMHYELHELSLPEILLACCVRASVLESQNRCFFRYPAIKQAVELTDAYIKDISQPQKAIAILVEAATRAKSGKNKLISTGLIQTIVSEKTHIPSQTLGRDESQKLLNLENELSKYIVGQEAAITAVAEGLRRARSGLASNARPLGSFLFLGPTGVGKTEIAKTLAKVYFGEEKFMLRMDMSEYQGQEGIDKLLGRENARTDSPVIKHLKNYPFCLLLLDEFEKASPEILNLFLQILEDGRLTTGKGETVDLTHTLIIATSNAGSAEIAAGIKNRQSIDLIKARLLDQLLIKYFSPELLNRFDGVIIFSPLKPDEVLAIVLLQLIYLKQQLLKKGIKVNFTPAVAADIAEKAYDPSLGARPIRRYIQDHVETFIAKLLLQKSIQRGSELTIDLAEGKLMVK